MEKLVNQYPADVAQAFIDGYDGSLMPQVYKLGFHEVYTLAQQGYGLDEIMSHPEYTYSHMLTPSEAENAYNVGFAETKGLQNHENDGTIKNVTKSLDGGLDDGLNQSGSEDAYSDIIRDGSHIQDGKLKPNVRYQAGEYEYIYTTDENGYVCKVHADELHLKKHQGRLRHWKNTVGKLLGDHAGHLIGDQFGGSPELDNLVSQAREVNLSKYKKIENQWAKALKNGERVSVDIDIHYDAPGGRPTSFDVVYKMGELSFQQTIYQ